jgi:hypothetical protein
MVWNWTNLLKVSKRQKRNKSTLTPKGVTKRKENVLYTFLGNEPSGTLDLKKVKDRRPKCKA